MSESKTETEERRPNPNPSKTVLRLGSKEDRIYLEIRRMERDTETPNGVRHDVLYNWSTYRETDQMIEDRDTGELKPMRSRTMFPHHFPVIEALQRQAAMEIQKLRLMDKTGHSAPLIEKC